MLRGIVLSWGLWGGLWCATVLTRLGSPIQCVTRFAGCFDRIARWRLGAPPVDGMMLERRALGMSRVIPRCNCLDQALAMRWVLAWCGERAVVIIGFRWSHDHWEGHAWLERADGARLLWSDEAKFREVWREPEG